MLELNPIFLSRYAKLVTNTAELIGTPGLNQLTLRERVDAPARAHLEQFWKQRSVDLSQVHPEQTLFSERDYRKLDTENPIITKTLINLGQPTAYKMIDVAVIPNLRHILLNESSTVGERFGDTENFRYNMACHGSYFGYSSTAERFQIDTSHPHFKVFNELNHFPKSHFTPIVVSNDINDKCFTHWFMSCLLELYYLLEVINLLNEPLLIFSYQPAKWQIETISQLLRPQNLKYTAIDKPTVFKEALIVGGIRENWFHGEYFRQVICSSSQIRPAIEHTRLFISRDDADSRKIRNQRDAAHLLLYHGFSIVEMSKFTYTDQISLIKGAEYIIFINGSSAMNLIYAKANAHFGMIGGPDDFPGIWSRSLANFGVFDISFFTASEIREYGGQVNYEIDLLKFSDWLTNFLNNKYFVQ